MLCSCSAINLFHHIKYFTIPLTFLLFSICLTSYFSTPSTSTGFTSSAFYPSTCSLYHITQLMFTARWILIEVDNCNLIVLVDTTLLMIYEPTYQFTSFLASCSLNTRSFVFNITLSRFFHSSTSFLLLSTCHFISFCDFLNTTPTSSYTFFILSANSVAFSTFSFLLYCWLQIQPSLVILANSSICDLQRIGDIIPTPDSFIWSVYLFVDERISTTWFQSLTFCSASSSTLL